MLFLLTLRGCIRSLGGGFPKNGLEQDSPATIKFVICCAPGGIGISWFSETSSYAPSQQGCIGKSTAGCSSPRRPASCADLLDTPLFSDTLPYDEYGSKSFADDHYRDR